MSAVAQLPRFCEPAPTDPGRRLQTVLVTGASGLLGAALQAALGADQFRVIGHSRTAPVGGDNCPGCFFPLEQTALIEQMVMKHRPDWIIHAAGNTNVDACERDPGVAEQLHVVATGSLARAARRHGSRFCYISTDSVYDGEQPGEHDETAATKPVNHYARTKRDGELACQAECPDALVARVNFFGHHALHARGLATWIVATLRAGLPVKGFTDVRFNPLLNTDLAAMLVRTIRHDLAGGVYNFAAADACSKYEFARRIAMRIGVDPSLVQPVALADAGLATPRPRNTVMAPGKLAKALGVVPPTIDDGLRRLTTSRAAQP